MSNSFRPWQGRDEDTEDPSTPRTDQATEMESQSKESQPYWEGMARVDQQLMG